MILRCVLVAGFPGTNLRFSIPTEYVIFLLQGRMLEIIPAQPYMAGDKIMQPLTALIADPMKRLKTVFAQVAPNPLILTNSKEVPIYLLCFAAGNPKGAPTAVKIAKDILK